jgi:hypothetical protein
MQRTPVARHAAHTARLRLHPTPARAAWHCAGGWQLPSCRFVKVVLDQRAAADRGYCIIQLELLGREGVDRARKRAADAQTRLMKLGEIPDLKKAEFLHLFRTLDGDARGGVLQQDLLHLTGDRQLAQLDADCDRRLDVFEFAVR